MYGSPPRPSKTKILPGQLCTPTLLVRLDDPSSELAPVAGDLPHLPLAATVALVVHLGAEPLELVQRVVSDLSTLLAYPAGKDDAVDAVQWDGGEELEKVL